MSVLLMPKFGLTMTEGLLSEWHIAEGAVFSKGDLLFTVETEKVANEVEAEFDGVLEQIVVSEGDTIAVGEPVATLAGADHKAVSQPQDGPAARKLMAENAIPRDQVAATGRGGRVMKEDVLRVIATPLARRIAVQQGVDLETIKGSGPRGRIKAADVQDAPTSVAAPVQSNAPTQITPDAARLATATRVSAAKRDIPHFYVTHEAEITKLTALRQALNNDDLDTRISVTHMLIRALGLALTEMPHMNRIWVGDHILAFNQADVGMVAETPNGLRIPVIRNAGASHLDGIAAAANDLGTRARDDMLTTSDVGDGVIAISNVGMFGVASLTPIISPPNAMILGVGAPRPVFRPDDAGAPVLRNELTLTLACDHRIIDGADAARFLSVVVAILEKPTRLLRPARTPI